ncbi:hypothetical protein EVAR_89882_1 [Eumeta japonica]|uniref:Uncharacterized protein n=1 Tax=Eumeta variegata TaxID=151549 RepID=A0A4C1ZP32_EUMVA|nr:hypothetical protein EVAR_89882_1 [Eumeta japonica]
MYIDVVSAVRRENKLRHSGLKTTARVIGFATNVTVVKLPRSWRGEAALTSDVVTRGCWVIKLSSHEFGAFVAARSDIKIWPTRSDFDFPPGYQKVGERTIG